MTSFDASGILGYFRIIWLMYLKDAALNKGNNKDKLMLWNNFNYHMFVCPVNSLYLQ